MTASEGPVVEKCPYCGAPLRLDVAGDCVWCHAHVRVPAEPTPRGDEMDAESAYRVLYCNPFEDEPDDVMLLEPVANLLSFLYTTGQEPPVQDFVAHWEAREGVAPLLAAVRTAGKRVTEAAMSAPSFNELADHSAEWTAGEWWILQLANDLLAMVASVPGLATTQTLGTMNEVRNNRTSYAERFAGADGSGADDALVELRRAVPQAESEPRPPDDAATGHHHLWRRHRPS